jgi:hypothetical protein
MFFWTSAAVQLATKLESMRNAEAKLLLIAKSYASRPTASWEIKSFDTPIPRSAIPLKQISSSSDGEETLTIHGVHVTSDVFDPSNSSDAPLVLLHGYMNAGTTRK